MQAFWDNKGSSEDQMSKSKSALDDIPVDDQAFPLKGGSSTAKSKQEEDDFLYTVGSCPKCGAPIYGPWRVADSAAVEAKHSCKCFEMKSFQDTIQNKEGT
jgi:hypothetical protein